MGDAAAASQAARDVAADIGGGGDDAFLVVGEVAGQSDQLFTDIAAYATGANPVTIDFAAAKRIDFVNAGRLLNVLEKQKA